MKYVVNWIPLRIRFRSRNTRIPNPTLKSTKNINTKSELILPPSCDYFILIFFRKYLRNTTQKRNVRHLHRASLREFPGRRCAQKHNGHKYTHASAHCLCLHHLSAFPSLREDCSRRCWGVAQNEGPQHFNTNYPLSLPPSACALCTCVCISVFLCTSWLPSSVPPSFPSPVLCVGWRRHFARLPPCNAAQCCVQSPAAAIEGYTAQGTDVSFVFLNIKMWLARQRCSNCKYMHIATPCCSFQAYVIAYRTRWCAYMYANQHHVCWILLLVHSVFACKLRGWNAFAHWKFSLDLPHFCD